MNALKLSNTRFGLLLAIILFIGATFRFLGASPGFNQFHSDEGISYSAAVSMLRNSNMDPLRYDYPALVPEINWLAFRFIFTPVYWGKYYVSNISNFLDGYLPLIPKEVDMNRIFQNEILGNREINALFWGRYTTALISSASIFAIFLLASRMFNRQVGFLSALLLALNFRSVTNAHLGLPDSYNAFFLLFSLAASWSIQKLPTKATYLLAGIAIGLSLGTKYQVFAVLPFLVSHIIRSLDKENRLFFRTLIDPKLFIAGLAAVFTFIAINPYLIIHFDFATYIIHEVSLKYAMGKNALSLFPVHYWIFNDYGLPLFILIVSGAVSMLLLKTKQAIFLLSHIIPFLFIMLFYSNGGFYVRNFITVTPLFLICAAWLLATLYEQVSHYSAFFASIITASILAVIIYLPVTNILIHTKEYQKPWNYKTIVDVTREVLPQNAVVVGHPFDPLPIESNAKRISISASHLYSLQEFRSVKGEYALINMDWAADPFYGWMTSSGAESYSYVFNKPYRQMRDTFWGLSVEEMMQHVVTAKYKPWQAPEAALFLVQVPYFGDVGFSQAKNVVIDNSWKKVNEEDASDGFLTINSDEKYMQIGPGSGKFQIAYLTSAKFEVDPGFVYKVTGSLASESGFENTLPNVFMRLDFYNSNDERVMTSVSNRFFGNKGNVEVFSQAPNGATFARISFQSSIALSGNVKLKAISISASTNKQPTKDSVVTFEDYKELLYPNSHGNL